MTNKRILYSLAAALLFLITACEKETTKDVSRTYKVPVIQITDGDFITVDIGSNYVDAGATYIKEDGTSEQIQATVNEVNTGEPGIFFVTYEKESESGLFNTVATRVVGVGYTGGDNNFSGTYVRAQTGESMFLTKMATGLYKVQNPGGSAYPHTTVVAYIVETAANQFAGPLQANDLVGDIELTDVVLTPTEASWRIINNPYYGTGTRVFTKQ